MAKVAEHTLVLLKHFTLGPLKLIPELSNPESLFS